MVTYEKVVILTGAPESSTLDWNPSGLLDTFQEQIIRFTGAVNRARTAPSSDISVRAGPSSAPAHALWRSVLLERQHIPTGFSQLAHDFGLDFGPGAPFISAASLSFDAASQDDSDIHSQHRRHYLPDDTGIASQFYEHSIAAHENVTSSQLVLSQSQPGLETTSFMTDDSASRTSFQSGDSFSHPSSAKPPLLSPATDIRNLKDLPTAAYITRIEPQTMTCNLIVGIISISQPREVKTRWGTRTLVEVLVGDDTMAGFAVTFWLAPNSTVAESSLAGLRCTDVVLIQNVALNSFMNKVYGSSLRKNLTRIHLLYRARLDPQDVGGYYSGADLRTRGPAHPQLAKTSKVYDWVLNFVADGRSRRTTNKSKSSAAPWDRPPLDSQ
ncbi:hypothetical protein V8F20_002177 [Naviculisporaceae sp. PSN 640]